MTSAEVKQLFIDRKYLKKKQKNNILVDADPLSL
jgi:hypothetical protein